MCFSGVGQSYRFLFACETTLPASVFVTGDDFDLYVAAFEGGTVNSDFDKNGFVNGDDFDGYVIAFEAGC